MDSSILHDRNLGALKYIVTHVFCPLQLPDGDDHSIDGDYSLASAVASAAHLYRRHIDEASLPEWDKPLRMLNNLGNVVRFESLHKSETISQLRRMDVGDTLAFLVRAQNAAVVFRKQKDVTIFEAFEVSPKAENVMTAQGKLVRSFPGPAIEVPNLVFNDDSFLSELVNFLVHMNIDVLDAAATTRKAQSTVRETRDTTDPRYITELLTGILRGVGQPHDVVRISKRVGDDVVWNNSKLPWRRSSLWLLIRVVLQTSLVRSALGNNTYKSFMLFFMCCLANEETSAEFSNDLLQFMSSKISRRLRKLGSSAPDWLSRTVVQTCTSLRSMLEKRWRQVQTVERVSPVWTPSQLDLAQDVEQSLLNSGDYIRNALAGQNTHLSKPSFNPSHLPRGSLDDFLSGDGTFFNKAYLSEPHVTLYDVERAVEEDIDDWVVRVTDNDAACEELELLANEYSSSARKIYGKNPELLSVMLLTTIELWVALDKIAIKQVPMLADYSPEIPMSLIETLLLSKSSNLLRLRRIHQYISLRHSQSRFGWSVFSATIATNSLPVRFYRSSSHLQSLKAEIEEVARQGVQEKVSELRESNARYAELQQRAAGTSHDTATNQYGCEYHPWRWCTKCSLESQCREMEIAVHEWPLPDEQLQAETVVFELRCPVAFDMWRSATFHLLVDLCSPSVEQNGPYILLSGYTALQPYLEQHPRSRITLASDAKPFVVTHYRKTSIPSKKENVCVNNGLQFYGYDTGAGIPVSGALNGVDTRKYCTYTLPSGPYESLQAYVDSTSRSSNEVIANQADCHKDLSLHEYIAFGHIRCGDLIQWFNILRELRGRSLTLRRHEVHLLLAQAVSQVGPLGDSGWTWHQEIQKTTFCYALLGELESLIRDVEANWLEMVTMDTVSFLLRRLLASSPDEHVTLKAVELLRTVRGKVFCWVEELSKKLSKTPEDDEFRGFLRDAAAICRGTFDVDPAMIPALLHSAEDVKVLVSCAILIRDHTPCNISRLSGYSQLLLDRNQRLSLVLEDSLRDIIKAGPNDKGSDSAISQLWPAFRPGSKWTPLRHPNSRWFSCQTAPTAATECAQEVHYNILDGLLLVDGKPVGRLPEDIVRHPTYDLIFGGQVLDVIPSSLPGMDYSTKGVISGHEVHFGFRNEELVIQAKQAKQPLSADPQIIELIPQGKLEDDLPAVFIEGHAHWLNLTTSVVEIRPLDTLWKSSSENWKICCTPGQYRTQKGNECLVDIRSRSWGMVSALLSPLEIPQNLIITVSSIQDPSRPSSLRLSAILPRYDLSFYVDEDGDLQSRNMRGMVYDENQSIGTLIGLVNRLVLRPKPTAVHAIELTPRCVLIPEGQVSFRKVGHHVRVTINTQYSSSGTSTTSESKPWGLYHYTDHGWRLQLVAYQTYRVDTDMGSLAGNVNLSNKLYCAYLHALTSGCSVDPLTGKSGTEEALSLLRSSVCRSFIKFTPRDAKLLGLIASICPSRTWYPIHLTCMQKVKWLDLPVHSQHPDLYSVSKAIREQYEKIRLFHEPENDVFQKSSFPSQDDHLLGRSAQRTVYMLPFGVSRRASREDIDVCYSSRDLMSDSDDSGEHRVYAVATAVYRRSLDAVTTKHILPMVESWRGIVSGDTTLSNLCYDKSWLKPNLPSIWLKAYKLLRGNDEAKWSQLLFSMPAMVYASPDLRDLVPVFVAFALHAQFQNEHPPSYESYTISDGYRPASHTLRNYALNCAHSFESSPESSEHARQGESYSDLMQRQRQSYDKRVGSDTDTIVNQLMNATWPCDTLPWFSLASNLYDVGEFRSNAQNHFSSCYCNTKLKEHLCRVQNILNGIHTGTLPTIAPRYSFYPSQGIPSSIPWSLGADQLLAVPVPSLRKHDRLPQRLANPRPANKSLSGSVPFSRLIKTAEANSAVSSFQSRYVSALRISAQFLGSDLSSASGSKKLPTADELAAHYTQCRDKYLTALEDLKKHLSPRSLGEQALEQSGQWPRITPYFLFRCLASNSPIILSGDWKKCLITFALIALELQRARRLLSLHLRGLHDEVNKELNNEGCDGWTAETHPDWLLIQLQGNFLVRRVQAEVANEMISPSSGENTAMQLNMGEGKSSVIVPIVVTALADGQQLVRVIVLKALTAQMFQILADRLGGLVNRRIYLLPFSRSVRLDNQKVEVLRALMSECMENGGILVVQPEHVLSLKLLSVEKQLPGPKDEDAQLAQHLLELQRWLYSHSRDILDESDEILHVRYQLVYTIGTQKHMEGFPERWTTTQQVLGLVKRHVPSLRKHFPRGVEYEGDRFGSFPHLRILREDAGQRLIGCIVEDVMNGLLPNYTFGQLRSTLRDAIRSFISCQNVHQDKVQLVKDYAQQTLLWGGLLHLRGLLATGILLFAFRERRWRVDYGLAPTRTMLAVPYRAKDVPAQRAEFGHPDIAIILSCLSYYYGGLTEEQLRMSFEILLKQDDPSLEYDLWVRECPAVPEYLKTLNGINIKSSEQWKMDLIRLFSRNRATVDFFLSSVVFPKEAKEFPSKLSCSGWDLAERKEHVLTGFSGTNDGQHLLPLHITQRDPDHQRGTNAKVLSYLLQPENQSYMCMSRENGERRPTCEFLKMLVFQKPAIRVLLDVGAQMLDLQNSELARAWLDVDPSVSAAIYFNEDDELTVRNRDGRTQLLLSSPFAQQLDQCVVYLDDAHTRGTDIKFPAEFRAAVTLGPKVTKDRLAQGCMRMRKLGHGHSIMFFAPLEIDQRIRSLSRKGPRAVIDTQDVLHWAIHETCDEIQQRVPHWAQQGMDHAARHAVWTDFCKGRLASDVLMDKWLQPEAKRLEELYLPRDCSKSTLSAFPDIHKRCIDLGVSSPGDVSMDEEQEREVIHEAEREQQVERPPKIPPASHNIHDDFIQFVETGIVPAISQAFRPAFETLAKTSAATDEAHVWSANLLTTVDFDRTVSSSAKLDEYLRPVQWVSVGERALKEVLVILSPHEANYLIQRIKSGNCKVRLHVYTPRITKSMTSCDDLSLYGVPTIPTGWIPSLHSMDQLNVFAGQLYLKDYETYIRLCRFLCVYARDLEGEENIDVRCDGFIAPTNRPKHLQSGCMFQDSPLPSVRTLIGLRRKGTRFAPTHMGYLLDGRLLSEEHFSVYDDDARDHEVSNQSVAEEDFVSSMHQGSEQAYRPGLGELLSIFLEWAVTACKVRLSQRAARNRLQEAMETHQQDESL